MMLEFLKDLWNDARPNFAENGFFLTLLNLILFICSVVSLSPFLLLWALNDFSKTWFKSDSK